MNLLTIHLTINTLRGLPSGVVCVGNTCISSLCKNCWLVSFKSCWSLRATANHHAVRYIVPYPFSQSWLAGITWLNKIWSCERAAIAANSQQSPRIPCFTSSRLAPPTNILGLLQMSYSCHSNHSSVITLIWYNLQSCKNKVLLCVKCCKYLWPLPFKLARRFLRKEHRLVSRWEVLVLKQCSFC